MKRILVAGSLNMDLVLKMDRIPLVGETVLGDEVSYSCGGKGANQAYAAGRLGCDVEMLGCVGADAFGAELVQNLASVNVKVDGIGRDKALKTGMAMINVERSGRNNIVVISGANMACGADHLRVNDESFRRCDYILLQLEIPFDAVWYAVRRGKELGKTVILNPAPAPERAALPGDILRNIDYIIPNETELATLSGTDGGDMERGAMKLIEDGVKSVIVTLGDKGSMLAEEGSVRVFPPVKVKAVDTTAAGDCFCAAFTAGLADGKSPAEAITFANMAAAIAVTRPGAQSSAPTMSEIQGACPLDPVRGALPPQPSPVGTNQAS